MMIIIAVVLSGNVKIGQPLKWFVKTFIQTNSSIPKFALIETGQLITDLTLMRQ